MTWRFRRTLKLAPGVRLNFGKTGASLSIGPRGATVTLRSRGVDGNLGLPGSGLSYRKKLRSPETREVSTSVRLELTDDGTLQITAPDGTPLPPAVERAVRRDGRAQLLNWLDEQCKELNKDSDKILHVHLDTPSPDSLAQEEMKPFLEPMPAPPTLAQPSWFDRFWPPKRHAIRKANLVLLDEHAKTKQAWLARKQAHNQEQAQAQNLHQHANAGDVDAMHTLLENRFHRLLWPRETLVTYTVRESADRVSLHVDLPEISDMPRQQARRLSRGLRISLKPRSETQRRKEYMLHVHGVAFRLVGEVFALLSGIKSVTVSIYSQRPTPATAAITDEYLLSARVSRGLWEEIAFDNLEALDVVACFDRFDLRRKMSRTGIFEAIEPFTD